MTQGTAPSLLDHLDTPVLVGDPDGCTVYVNPAFETHFGFDSQKIRGQSLAELFEGGAREAILRAVADVCSGAGNARVQLRDANRGYIAIASPISAGAGNVGVIILLTEEQLAGDRLLACSRGLSEPLDGLTHYLSEAGADLSDHVRVRAALFDAAKEIDDLRKRADELIGILTD